MHAYLGGTTGERITDLILENKTSQATLARAVHVSEATMSRYINGTSEIPGDVLLGVARYFDVTTDFLLGATDIPFKTNYDLDRLGLSKEAAEKMLSGELDMQILNKLLANEDFAILTDQIAQYVHDIKSESMAVMNQVLETAGEIVKAHAKTHPLDKERALRAYRDIRGNMTVPKPPETAAMESSWARILVYMREGAEERIRQNVKLTSDIMEGIVGVLEKRKGTFEPHEVTIRDIVQAIINVTAVADLPDAERQEAEEALCTIFERYARGPANDRRHPTNHRKKRPRRKG